MKQTLHDYWTIDVDSTFSRRTTDDGFVVFEGPGISLWAIVYIVQDFNPHEAIRGYVKGWNFDDCELVAKREDNGIAGRAYLSKGDGVWKLTAFASAYARIVELRFLLRSAKSGRDRDRSLAERNALVPCMDPDVQRGKPPARRIA